MAGRSGRGSSGGSSLGSEWVYDELLCFVGSPLFQLPVATFMENNCLIFDQSVDDCTEYRDVHTAYRDLVTALLEAFRQDTNLTHEQIINAMTEMSKKEDLREIFQDLFTQILATESFAVFVRCMTEKNIELQQQALLLLLHRLGHTPESLKMADRPPQPAGVAQQQPSQFIATVAVSSTPAAHEEAVFRDVIRSAKPGSDGSTAAAGAMDAALSVEEVSKLEAEKKKEQQRLSEAVKRMTLAEEDESDNYIQMESKAIPKKAAGGNGGASSNVAFSTLAAAAAASAPSAAAAAASSTALQAGGRGDGQATEEEIRKRQEFLRQQKEKLVALKRKEREKQLDAYEQQQQTLPAAPPQLAGASPSELRLRPKSSRAARSVLGASSPSLGTVAQSPEVAAAPSGEDEQKKMAMRRAIANRIRAEMLGK